VAELGVVVVAHAGLQRMRAEAALVLDEGAEVVATVAVEAVGAGDVVVLPVQAGAEQLFLAEAGIHLHRGQVAAGAEHVHQAAAGALAVVAVCVVAGATELGLQRNALGDAPVEPATDDLLQVVGFVATEHAAVVLVAAVRIQHVGLHFHVLAQLHAATQVDRGVAMAVAVGLVDIAARAPAGGSAAAGVYAFLLAMPGAGRDPAAP